MLARADVITKLCASLRIAAPERELLQARAELAASTEAVKALGARRSKMEMQRDVRSPNWPDAQETLKQQIAAISDEQAQAVAKESAARHVERALHTQRCQAALDTLSAPIHAFEDALQEKLDELGRLLALGIALDAEAKLEGVSLETHPVVRGANVLFVMTNQQRALLEKWRQGRIG